MQCQIYTGKSRDAAEVGQGKRVVLEMTEGLQGQSTVTCDNFFTSVPLAEKSGPGGDYPQKPT